MESEQCDNLEQGCRQKNFQEGPTEKTKPKSSTSKTLSTL